ncbi:small ribosomal subunit protein eS12 [Bacillus rossius redtenbacheri]|uniref:small ribosomal subunit protein eS12 n=1 Tax=Bacillus rossius redtenbacheri TaxID=93214 RepID=UPI002FDEE0C9
MSDVETDEVAPPPSGSMDINNALQEVLKMALTHGSLAHGLHESSKALDKRQALLCILADNCNEPSYKKLVEALCNEHQIPLIKVDNNKKLGEWAGLCKIDNTGKARKVVGCSCVVIKDYGEETPAYDALREYLKQSRQT